MAVITRYIVVRNNIELDQVFTDKKEAEAYDKMLEASENLAKFIKEGEHDAHLDDKTINAIAIYLAQNALDVIKILKNIKFLPAPSMVSKKEKIHPVEPKPIDEKKKQQESKAKSTRKGSA